MLVSLTVGKVDAGVAVLLTEDKRLIEFPSILLPPDITSGSIVDVNVARNFAAEDRASKAFSSLQSRLLSEFGTSSPSPPILRCRNATQTSVVLEWDPIALASASLRTLSLYRNGNKAGNIPRPFEMTSTKISGLAVDTEYTFNLVLRTTAGTFSSDKLIVKTHKMTNLSGITVTPGALDSAAARADLAATVARIGAKLIEQVRIDTTHFVCTEPRGAAWERARDMNIPIVVPDWVRACEREGRIAGVRGYYLDADPKLRQTSLGTGPGPAAAASHAVADRSRQESVVSPMTGGPGQPPALDTRQGTGGGGAARSMSIPATQITPPTPETTSEEFRNSVRGQHAEASAAPKVETVPEAPEPEAETMQAEEGDDVGDETTITGSSSANGVDAGAEPEDGDVAAAGLAMPGGASLSAQHADDAAAADVGNAATTGTEEEGAGEAQDFDEVKL